MKEKALKTLQRITSLFDKVFRDLGDAPGDGAREGKSLRQYMAGCHSGRTGWRGMEHIGRVFRYLKEIIPLSS